MDGRLFWRSLGVQALCVAVLSLVLAALLPREFFEDWGFAAGPLAWAVCSLVTARAVNLPIRLALLAALVGGVAGTIAMVLTTHWAGVVAALVVFAASCGTYGKNGEQSTVREQQ